MKGFILSILTVALTLSTFAQLPVDSTVQHKNVVLEEYTGINCPFCPDGHKIANNIQQSHSGDVFMINVHTGKYAKPKAGQPDFRTQYGSKLAKQADMQSYPAATVNRHLFPGLSQQDSSGTAMSRSNWQTAVDQMLKDTAYVNIAMNAKINAKTRELVVDVEVYFTKNTAPAEVYLTMIVNQNDIPGPQSGAATHNPSQILPNGKYNHLHMLRDMITGQWGDKIDTTTKGTLIQRQYTYNIPGDINNVLVEMSKLEVIGFIAESHQEIINAAEVPVSYVTPQGIDITDLEVEPKINMPGFCDHAYKPRVQIINNSTNPVDTFRVGYKLNNGNYTYKTVTSTLAAGDSTIITFADDTLSPGKNVVEFNANVDSTDHLVEISIRNNTEPSSPIYTLPPNPFDTNLWEDFESYSAGDAKPDHSFLIGQTGKSFVLNQSKVPGLNHPIGAYGNSGNSYCFYFYEMSVGIESSIVFEKLDFSGKNSGKLRFDHAYAQYQNEKDNLKILVSADCGANWTTVYNKSGSALATAPANSGGAFYPKFNQWTSDTVDINAMGGESEVLLKIKATSDFGNNLFLDNIVIYDANTVGQQEKEGFSSLNVYPNPVTDIVNVDMTLNKTSDVQVNVINSKGQIVHEELLGTLSAGKHNRKIVTENLSPGLYNLQVIAGNKLTVEQISILK